VAAAFAVAACGGGSTQAPRQPVSTLLAAGSAALRQGDYTAAEQLFTQAVTRDPKQVAGYYDLGVTYQDEHNDRDALKAYAKAQALDPRFVPVIYNRAVLYSANDPQLAIFLYRKAISLQRDSPSAYLNLGLLEATQGPQLRRQAEKDLAMAVQLAPSLAGRIPGPLRAGLPSASRRGATKAHGKAAASPSPSAS
jgi:tetratricopeptide (TPR) repeat protein